LEASGRCELQAFTHTVCAMAARAYALAAIANLWLRVKGVPTRPGRTTVLLVHTACIGLPVIAAATVLAADKPVAKGHGHMWCWVHDAGALLFGIYLPSALTSAVAAVLAIASVRRLFATARLRVPAANAAGPTAAGGTQDEGELAGAEDHDHPKGDASKGRPAKPKGAGRKGSTTVAAESSEREGFGGSAGDAAVMGVFPGVPTPLTPDAAEAPAAQMDGPAGKYAQPQLRTSGVARAKVVVAPATEADPAAGVAEEGEDASASASASVEPAAGAGGAAGASRDQVSHTAPGVTGGGTDDSAAVDARPSSAPGAKQVKQSTQSQHGQRQRQGQRQVVVQVMPLPPAEALAWRVSRKLAVFIGTYSAFMVIVAMPSIAAVVGDERVSPADARAAVAGEQVGVSVFGFLMWLVWGVPKLCSCTGGRTGLVGARSNKVAVAPPA